MCRTIQRRTRTFPNARTATWRIRSIRCRRKGRWTYLK
jgi:hypothetical protein